MAIDRKVHNDSTSSRGLGDIRFLGFSTTVYDAFVVNDSGDLNPQALRFDRQPDAINFNFTRNNSGGLEPGQASSYFFLDTEAFSFNEADLGWDITNLGQSNNSDFFLTGFAPDPVPEKPPVDVPSPPTLPLLTLGLVALWLTRRKC